MMRPIFSANHHWAMAMGLKSLELEIARRHAASEAERALIPAPPPPTTTSSLPLLAGLCGIGAMIYLLYRLIEPRSV